MNWREPTPEHDYSSRLFAQEDSYLKNIRESLRSDKKEGINIDPYEGRFLQLIISIANISTVVEIGTLYGYSTLWIARALPSHGKIISFESNLENYEKAKALLSKTEVWSRVDLRFGDAHSLLNELHGPFDMAFIDANKSGYTGYLDWSEKNIRKDGLIVGDNTLLFGHMVGRDRGIEMPERAITVMREFNQRLSDSSRYRSVLVPTLEGMTIAQKLFV